MPSKSKTVVTPTPESSDEANPQQILQERFGLQTFREGQAAVIERVLQGKSVAAVFPTGGGKSLCYQLPATLLPGLTVVVSPLLALMREQVEDLVAKGIPAARLDSSLSAAESREVSSGLRDGTIKILYVAPERFFNERFRQLIAELPISLFAVDEAHCISQWGHNFRPDFLKLANMARELSVDSVLALTATATPPVLEDIRREFEIAPEDAICTGFYRSNLSLRFTACEVANRCDLLEQRLSESPPQSTLVYVSLQKTAESVAEHLNENGHTARAYHAGLPDETRAEIQDWFMKSKKAVVVATIAFGMGIDKADIRAIYHFNVAKSVENYAQEVGRAGRDGLPAICESLVAAEDRVVLDNFAYGNTPTLDGLRTLVTFLAGQPPQFHLSYYAIAHETDIRETVIRTLLTRLELDGFIQATSPRYESYRFKPRVSSAEILKHFEGERRQFASSVLSMAVKKKIWFEISIAQTANRLHCERNRVVSMLDYFAEQGWIELRVAGLVHGYRKLRDIDDIAHVVDELYDYVQALELGELSRLSELFEMMTSARCLSNQLSSHFGQSMPDACGHCSVCDGHPMQMPEPTYPQVGDSAIATIKRLVQQQPEALHDIRQQARFLCGLSSPLLVRKRLTRDAAYGCCAAVPFEDVLDALTAASY